VIGRKRSPCGRKFRSGLVRSFPASLELITHDERILTRAQGFDKLLPPSLKVVTLTRFFEIFDACEAREQA
jgi:hypothetical protein